MYGGGGIHEYELEVLADDVSDQNTSLLDQFQTFFMYIFLHDFCSVTRQAQTEHPGDSAHSHRWTSLELVKGTYSTDDSPSDIAEIRLDKAVPLKVHRISAK